MALAVLLPLLNIELKPPQPISVNNFQMAEHFLFDVNESVENIQIQTVEKVSSIPWIAYILFAGMIICGVRMIYQFFHIYMRINRNEQRPHGKYRFVLLDHPVSSHSFFHYIFLYKSDFGKDKMKDIVLHEQVHADKGHSLDLLLIGILCALQWFNPFIYLLRRAIVAIHEYEADQLVIDQGIDRIGYQQLLLNKVNAHGFLGLTSSFNQTIVLNRLKMMNKIRSGNHSVIKYAMVLPLVFILGISFCISQKSLDESMSELVLETPVVPFSILSKVVVQNFPPVPQEVSELSREGHEDDYLPSIYPVDENKIKGTPSGFGIHIHPILKKEQMHNGADFSAKLGTPIKATALGRVRIATFDKIHGKYVIIDHGEEFSTAYMHLTDFIVKDGQEIEKGEIIGHVGNTGLSSKTHLHYEVMKGGEYVDPINYLGESKE